MTTENPDLAPANPGRWRRGAGRHWAAFVILVVPGLLLLAPAILVQLSNQSIIAYPFATYLPWALIGLYVAFLGVLCLVWADTSRNTSMNPFGEPNYENRTLAGAWMIAFGPLIFAGEGLPLLVRPTNLTFTLLWPWFLLWPLIVATPFVVPALWRLIQRRPSPEPRPAAQASRVSRRTLLLGAGVVAIGASGIGALLVRLPTMIPHVKLRGQLFFPNGLAWSPDGRRIATTDKPSGARIWSAATGSEMAHHSQAFGAGAVSWSPDGRRVATASWDNGAAIQVWDAATGTLLLSYTATSGEAVAWSPRDNRIATTTLDDAIVIFDATTGKNLLRFGANIYGQSLIWSPDARMLAAPSGGGVGLWHAATGQLIRTVATNLMYLGVIAWSPDGTRIATANQDGTARVYRVLDGAQLAVYRGHSEEVNAVAWSPDGHFVVSGSDDNTAQVWSAATGRHVYTWNGHMAAVKFVAWQPGGSLVASGSSDSTVQVWQPSLS